MGDAEAEDECSMLDTVGAHKNVVARLFKAIGKAAAVRVPRALFSDALESDCPRPAHYW